MFSSLDLKKAALFALTAIVVVVAVFYVRFFESPVAFPEGSVIRIEKGETLTEVAEKLKERNIIKSEQWLLNLVILLRGENAVIAGDYYFGSAEDAPAVARRIVRGDFGLEAIKVTIPEGLMRWEVAEILEGKLPLFDKERFLLLTEDREGYLFPETYFFLPTIDEDGVVERFRDSFREHTSLISDDIEKFGRPIEEVVIMASILEEEATTTEDRRKVAGILWKRIEIGMPLQVDASFLVINGKTSAELTREDLGIDSPYNTYRYRGLPPGPLSSPGLDSLLAATNPIETEYLFYLSENDGTMHYAETLEEHGENRREFLSDS